MHCYLDRLVCCHCPAWAWWWIVPVYALWYWTFHILPFCWYNSKWHVSNNVKPIEIQLSFGLRMTYYMNPRAHTSVDRQDVVYHDKYLLPCILVKCNAWKLTYLPQPKRNWSRSLTLALLKVDMVRGFSINRSALKQCGSGYLLGSWCMAKILAQMTVSLGIRYPRHTTWQSKVKKRQWKRADG